MDAIRSLSGVNLNVADAGLSFTAAATTITLAAAAVASIDGKIINLVSGAKAFAPVKADGVTVDSGRTLVATATTGQAVIVVHCLNESGALKSVIGTVVNLDATGLMKDGPLVFPNIPDNLVPIAYGTVKNPAGSSTATFTFGTTNWNATSIVTTAVDVVALPRRPLTSV